jgi:hypothetical protein
MMTYDGTLELTRETMTPSTIKPPSTEKNKAVIKGSSRPIFQTILGNRYASPGAVGRHQENQPDLRLGGFVVSGGRGRIEGDLLTPIR